MVMNRGKGRYVGYLPLLIFFLACLFLAFLVSSARPDVFFSGDGGLKFLILKQAAVNGHYTAVDPAPDHWVNHLWSQGYYPFKPPFVYDMPEGRIVSFPPFFQMLSLPLYQLFGFKGLYLIPAISLVLLWLMFLYCLRTLNISPLVISAGLAGLAFSAPLTLYGAMYWEHTLAILLVFTGVAFLLRQPVLKAPAIAAGLLTGLSGLFRPELILLSSMLVVAVLNNYCFRRNTANLVFAACVSAVILLYFGFNGIMYSNIFGPHGIQLTQGGGIRNGFILLIHLNARFLGFFPLAAVFYSLALYLSLRRPAAPLVIYQLTLIVTLYLLVVPFFMPNGGGKQWGPRYFLPMVPLMIVALCLASASIKLSSKATGIATYATIILMTAGIYLNVIAGTSTLVNDYCCRVTPGINFVKSQTCDIVVVQNQFIAQEFAAVFREKKFFLAEDAGALISLVQTFRSLGITQMIYISSANENTIRRNELVSGNTGLKQIGNYFFARYSL